MIVENSNEVFYLFLFKLITLPVDGESTLKIILQDKIGRVFPQNIKGLSVGVHFSHPLVAEVTWI